MDVLLISSSVLLALSVLALVFPYIAYPALLSLLPHRGLRQDGAKPASMSLLFCFFNEAEALPVKIENLRALRARYPDLEILAYDDGSTDGSSKMLEALPGLLSVVRGDGRRGKAHGMKRLASGAAGEILIFSDANVILDPDAPFSILEYFTDPEIGGVCGALHYRDTSCTATEAVGSLYWRIEERIKRLESRSGNVMGADGSIFATRRELYPDFPDNVLDDFTVSMEVVFRRMRLVHAIDVRAYEYSVSDSSEEFRRKLRIATRAMQTHMVLRPRLRQMSAIDQTKYFLHKVLRWAGGLFLGITALSFIGLMTAVSPVLGILALVALVALSGFVVTVPYGPVRKLREVVFAIIATTAGAIRGLRGHNQVTWSPAKSR